MKHQIGDNEYLRALSDKLQARDIKVLPDNVDTGNWIPVIPYDTTLNVVDEYHAIIESGSYISTNIYNVTVGSGTFAVPTTDLVLPEGFIYTLRDFEIFIDFGSPVAAGDNLRFDVREEMDRWPIVDPGGVSNTQRTHYKQRQLIYQQNPFRLFISSTTYSYTWPKGNYLQHQTERAVNVNNDPFDLYCPINSRFGTRLRIVVSYYNSSFIAKNFPVGTDFIVDLRFSRKPLDKLTVGGITDIVPP